MIWLEFVFLLQNACREIFFGLICKDIKNAKCILPGQVQSYYWHLRGGEELCTDATP